jgi:hypothetical protein
MSNVIFRYSDAVFELSNNLAPLYPYNSGINFFSEILQPYNYQITNRDIPESNNIFEIRSIKESDRIKFWNFWNSTIEKGNKLFTICDNKKRFLFDVFWDQWKEKWKKSRGGIYDVIVDIKSFYTWTPPTFAFYPFISSSASGYGCHSTDSLSTLLQGTAGSISSNSLIYTDQASSDYAAYNKTLSWFQQKDNSSISLMAQFRCGELKAGSELTIINLSDDYNNIRIYIKQSEESSSVGLSSSSSQGLSSSSSAGLSSSSSSAGLSSSSSAGLSSSSSLNFSESSSLGLSSSSILDDNYSSSSLGLSSSQGYSSSQGISSQGSSYSSASTSSNSSSSESSSSDISDSDSSASSSSQEDTTEFTIIFEWTKSGYPPEYISLDSINVNSESIRCWYDICGTFDNVNNQFRFYICKSTPSTVSWSYTNDFLYNTISLLSTAENSISSDISPTNYPEGVIWSSLYLLESNQGNIYVDTNEKAELKYVMIIDEFVPASEFNWLRRIFHYWNKQSTDYPK